MAALVDLNAYVIVFCCIIPAIFASGGGANGKAVQMLEHKLFRQQEELTELHRNRGEVLVVCPMQMRSS